LSGGQVSLGSNGEKMTALATAFLRHALAGTIAIGTSPVGAAPDCRGPGFVVAQDEIACLRMRDGLYLARCVMVLNTSSWRILPDACPAVGPRLSAPAAAEPPAPNP
jgi:hypothetical protein